MKSLFPRNLKQILLYQTLFAAFMLFSALTGQYVFDLHPCDLCIYQRYPYFAILVFGVLGYMLVKTDKFALSMVILCVVLLLVDSGIAFYHTGVEYGWFEGPDACSNADSGEMTLEEMRAAIMGAPLVTCSQAMAYILGLSMAAWNAMMAFGAAMLSMFAMKKVL
ncbi:MAG: disulfide bond formation protein B [Rickettsiales bacterium]